jgi:hypothetical protein
MPPLQQQFISGFVAGNKLDVFRTVSAIPAGRTLAKCWLTVKSSIADADPGAVQKTITTASGAGTGTITAIGDGTGGQPLGTGAFFFEFTNTDTLNLGAKRYVYDVKMLFDNGDIATLEIGTFQLVQGVTTATS